MLITTSIKKNYIHFISFTLVIFLSSFGLISEGFSQKLDSLFQSDELLYLELRTDYNVLEEGRWSENERKGGETEYQDAVLLYGPEDDRIEIPLRVKARGVFRRNPQHCKFPPLMLNFKKKEVKNTLFEKQDKLKLVTTCQTEPEVVKEYLIYKMYNEITEFSYNVRMVEILYFNTAKNKKLNERIGFLREGDERASKRNNAEIIKKHHFPFDLNPDSEAKLSMFQFMIGNTDWFYTTGQNMDVMYPEDTTLAPIPVPYDFDFSEFVNADYTKPAGVSEDYLEERRVFKGMCLSEEKLNEVLEFYNMMKPKLLAIINDTEYLSKFSKKQCLNYLEDFYTIINTPDMLQTEVLDTCLTRKDYIRFE
jgi:hypothetical protein